MGVATASSPTAGRMLAKVFITCIFISWAASSSARKWIDRRAIRRCRGLIAEKNNGKNQKNRQNCGRFTCKCLYWPP